jgi:hypothetical protein
LTTASLQKVQFASGHTATNAPDLFRTPNLTVAGPFEYWGGGARGKPFGCCWLFEFATGAEKISEHIIKKCLVIISSSYCHIFGTS